MSAFFFSCTLKLRQSACRKSDVMRVGGGGVWGGGEQFVKNTHNCH